MKARQEKTIIITASPKELRDLADKMEERWSKLTPGQTTFVDFIDHEGDLDVHLHLDQGYFHKLKQRENNNEQLKIL